jgi:tRNA(Ile)-lysidine synthase
MSLTANPEQAFTDKVRAFFRDLKIPGDSRIIIAYSGGPDSTALLYSLHSIKHEFLFDLCCAYLNHGLRSESELDRETATLKKVTAALRVELLIGNIPPGFLEAEARKQKRSLEDVARRKRYTFLSGLLKQRKGNYIALGHNADDQAETLIMRFFQGSGPPGLRGIKAIRGTIIRPLLSCSRSEILAYLAARKAVFIHDSSNTDMRFLRNRIRHRLIPLIKEVFPGFGRALSSFRVKNDYADEFIQKQAAEYLVWKRTVNGFCIPEEKFFHSPPIIRLYSLYNRIDEIVKKNSEYDKARVPFRFLRPLLKTAGPGTQKTRLCGFGLIVYIKDQMLFLERDVVVPVKKDYVIEVKPDNEYIIETKEQYYRFVVTTDAEKERDFSLTTEKINQPLILRTRRPGDCIDFGWGHKKLKKLFNERKIPPVDRDFIPLLVDKKGVVVIIGTPFGLNNFFRIGVAMKDNLDKNVLHCLIQRVER